MTKRVLVLGGYGVFGARLSRALIADGRYDVFVAGRTQSAAEDFCDRFGGTPCALDRTDAQLVSHIAHLAPFVVIDAAGPFQDYGPNGYTLARAAIECDAHYIDLSDDAEFSAGIHVLEDAARARGVAVISGASSVPGLSSAAVEALAADLQDIDLIESIILPGNRAPRGVSVVRAILGQVGRPIRVWRGRRWTTVPGWGGLRRENIEIPGAAPLSGRWSSYIGAPDLVLFPERFGARTVLFRAGLELSLLHLGLWVMGMLVRIRLMPSLAPLARFIRWVAQWFEPFGTDRGGMVVRVVGTTGTGSVVQRRWLLLAEAGDGPEIPTLAAQILCDRVLRGVTPAGARACIGEFDLTEVETAAQELSVSFARDQQPCVPVFQQALGPEFDRLPAPLRDLHRCSAGERWVGRADVDRGSSVMARTLCGVMGFPPTARNIPIEVEMICEDGREIWVRKFAQTVFRSEMRQLGRPGTGLVTERFGGLTFEIALSLSDGALIYPVKRAWCFGVPLPRWLIPVSNTAETVDAGRASFDVEITMPLIGRVIRYRGWLNSVP